MIKLTYLEKLISVVILTQKSKPFTAYDIFKEVITLDLKCNLFVLRYICDKVLFKLVALGYVMHIYDYYIIFIRKGETNYE